MSEFRTKNSAVKVWGQLNVTLDSDEIFFFFFFCLGFVFEAAKLGTAGLQMCRSCTFEELKRRYKQL